MANGAQNASGTPAPAASHSGGHVVSARATTIGLMAILLWSFMAGTVRIVSENFGATLGSALIYTVGGILLYSTCFQRSPLNSVRPRKVGISTFSTHMVYSLSSVRYAVFRGHRIKIG